MCYPNEVTQKLKIRNSCEDLFAGLFKRISYKTLDIDIKFNLV